MCDENGYCEVNRQTVRAWSESRLPAIAGVGLVQSVMAQILMLADWREQSFRSAEWANRCVRISVSDEVLGDAIAGLLLKDTGCCRQRVSEDFIHWSGVYAGQELYITARLR